MHQTESSSSRLSLFRSCRTRPRRVSLVVFVVCFVFVASVARGDVDSSSNPLLKSLERFKRSAEDNRHANIHHRRRHRHLSERMATDNSTSLLDKLRTNAKRCRYSSADQEELENYARNNQVKTSTTYEESFNYYGNHNLDYDERRYRNHSGGYRSGGFVKQPRVREQSFGGRHHHGHHQGFADPSVEIEKLFVDIGDLVNLTCNINSKEIDWHFKDKNLTTTIISNGPYLQVEQSQIPMLFHKENDDASLTSSRNSLTLKYRLSSDRHSSHMLTLYVQGYQDEGSYQCIDSKSETPIKKTIRVILKNNSRALTSGIASHSASIWVLALALIAINRQIQ